MLKDELKEIKSNKTECRKFGITIGVFLFLLAALLFGFTKEFYPIITSIAGLLIIAGIVFPNILKPLQIAWMGFATILGYIMSRVIIIILFYFVVTPIGLVAKLFGKDFLDRKLDRSSDSYWQYREVKEYDPRDTEKQF